MVFTEVASHPGDSKVTYRLRRVMADYSCAIDIEQTTDLQSAYSGIVRDHIKELFDENFNPQVFAIEEERVGYDETSKRLNASLTIVYQSESGNPIVEITQSLTYRENRTIDYTPVHGGGELDMYADPGWATVQRVWDRTVIAIGDEKPAFRIAGSPSFLVAGDFGQAVVGAPDTLNTRSSVSGSGWNVISNESKVQDFYLGDPRDEQMKLFILTETVVEQYNRQPSGYGNAGALGGGPGGAGGFGSGIGSGGRGNTNTTYYGFGLPGARSGVGVLNGRRNRNFGIPGGPGF
jgi:hypothetical protein